MGQIKTKIPGIYLRAGKNGSVLILDKWFRGERIYETLGQISHKEAENALKKREAEILDGKYKPVSVRSLTVGVIIEHYWKEHYAPKLDAGIKWVKDARCHFRRLDERIGHVSFEHLKRSIVEGYKLKRLSEVSPRAVQAELQVLNMAVTYLVDSEVLPHNPVRRFCSVPQLDPRKTVLDHGYVDGQEWQAIREHGGENGLMWELMYYAGMRKGEVLAMRHDWVRMLDDSHWLIEIPWRDEKTSKTDRRIPVAPQVRDGLAGLLRLGVSGLLFAAPGGGMRKNVYTAWNNTIRRAKLQKRGITPHALRRTCLTVWSGIDATAARIAAGHSTKDVHEHNYVHVTDERLFRLVGVEYQSRLRLLKKTA